MTSYEIMGASACFVKPGTIMSLWEFDDAIYNEIVVPRNPDVKHYKDCYEVVPLATLDRDALTRVEDGYGNSMTYHMRHLDAKPEPPESHPTAIRITEELAIVEVVMVGNSRDDYYAGGIAWEMEYMGQRDVLDPDVNDVPGGYYRDIIEALYGYAGQIDKEVTGAHVVLLWEYRSGRDPDTYMGPGEYWSEWELVGWISDEALAKLAKEPGYGR